MLIEERAAKYLATRRVQLVTINGKLALMMPEGRLARIVRRLREAISGRRRPIDAEAIVG